MAIRREPCLLLVEDEETDRVLFSAALRRIQAPVFLRTVPDGWGAILYLEAKELYSDRTKYPLPDLIVLDLRMPIVNGFEFLRWRQTSAFARVPVIVLEASGMTEDHQRALGLGAEMVFRKPPSLGELSHIAGNIYDLALAHCNYLPLAGSVCEN
jgi:CheY-like chemotaxis protein